MSRRNPSDILGLATSDFISGHNLTGEMVALDPSSAKGEVIPWTPGDPGEPIGSVLRIEPGYAVIDPYDPLALLHRSGAMSEDRPEREGEFDDPKGVLMEVWRCGQEMRATREYLQHIFAMAEPDRSARTRSEIALVREAYLK